jgi:hypothetical protein
MSPRTYRTEANAFRYLRILQTKYPAKLFQVMLAPEGSFRFAVGIFCEPDRWALCA